MPSCVVKSCKNHSGTVKKSQGITFHRFPSSNDVWKNDWVEIIRESRKESGWIPSKSSVVCSIHFQDRDLYTTKGGLLRIITYAVPKKFLYETSSSHVQQFEEERTSSASHEKISSETSKFSEAFAAANTSSAAQGRVLVVGESCVQGWSWPQPCLVLKNANTMDLRSSMSEALSNKSSKTVTPPPGVDLEQPLYNHSPRKQRMKEQLMKMHTLVLNQKKKIKTLNQKVRRLQNRNKEILKALKEKD